MPSVHAYFNKKNALVAKDQADGLRRGQAENSRRGQVAAPVILMVSGGADSMALLHMAATEPLDLGDGAGLVRIAKERLHVLHVNHLLRGADADADQHFVQATCDSLGIPCTALRVDVAKLAQERDGNVEEITIKALPSLVQAKTDAEFDAAKAKLMADLKAANVEKSVSWWKENWNTAVSNLDSMK